MESKFIVKKNDQVGRYCNASSDLKPGEIIFCEEPFSFGPKNGSLLTCLGCHKLMFEMNLCNKCSWPTCNENCSNQEVHSKNECQIFSSVGVKFNTDMNTSSQMECITVLRTLLESERSPNIWAEEVSIMEAHTNGRKSRTEWWDAEQTNVVDFLYDRCKLGNKFEKEMIQTVCGILEVNCFEIMVNGFSSIRGLYPTIAILSHSCVANTTHSKIPNSNYKMVLRTTTAVNEGEELFCSYTKSTDPTLLRRIKLWENKYFHCECQRCCDVTELGTHLNTLKCTKCDNGLVMTTNPLDNDAPWKCTHCDYGVTGAGVQMVYKVVQDEMLELEQIPFGPEKIEAYEKLLKKYKSFLHPRHSFRLALCYELSQLYGRAEGYSLDMLPDIMLERKVEMCLILLQTFDIIEPGFTRLRGWTLYELHAALLLLTRSQYEHKSIKLDKFKEEIKKVANILVECGNILSLEPEGAQEAEIAASAFQAASQLKTSLEQLINKENES